MAKVYVADDEKNIRELLGTFLSNEDLTVELFETGDQLLLRFMEEEADVVVLDVMMPGMDGPQTLEKLVNLVDINVVPVAFMTAKVQPAEVEHYLSLGARDVIIKPFDPMQLASQIRAIWSRSNG